MTAEFSSGALELTYLQSWLDRLIRLRWLAIIAVAFAVLFGSWTGLLDDVAPLWCVALWMPTYNLALRWWQGPRRTSWGVDSLHRFVLFQLILDVFTLSLLLHFSDSVENPAEMFFAFPVAAAAMLLPGRKWPYVTTAAALMHGGAVLLEYAGILAHHPLAGHNLVHGDDPLFRSGFLVAGYGLGLVIMLNGVGYLVYIVAREHRRAEALRYERERVAISRQRLAHVGQIAAGVAHSVRSPLHGLLNCVDLLRPQCGDPASEETLEMMGEGLRRIELITRRLLTLTREAPLERAVTRIDDLVHDALHMVAPNGSPGAVELETVFGGVGEAEVDAGRLSESVANILDNAIAACAGGGRVSIRTRCDSEHEGRIHIEISDTGVGIPEQQLEQIFDPFFTTKPVGEGTGLGLAIARQVIEAHGGEIAVESQPQRGTRFRVVFPRRAVSIMPSQETGT
ncbi:MAG: GHKL domain-containing protein [Deltaproteobacteria bacterium]|nr:GHKL domain-containing protein [Deltaproteobacteria bacterium]